VEAVGAEGPEVETVGRPGAFKSSSKAGNYYLPIARGMIWKLLARRTATAVSK